MASLANNILWNSLRTASNLLFPLITFPYISRTLGPAVKGEYEYVNAIVGYFILFANLGFPIYGIREIANNRNNRSALSAVASSIFTVNVLSAISIYMLYLLFCFIFPLENLSLYLIVGLSILFSCIQFDWFYQGIEDFKYITIRSIIIKGVSVIALFLFVHGQNDLLIYAVISLVAIFGSNVINLFYINHFAALRFSFRDAWKHINGAMTLFLGTIAISLYTSLNTIMLGTFDTNESVGYFTTSNRIVQIVLTIITAILSTMIPRISYELSSGDKERGNSLQYQILNTFLYICYPMTVGMMLLAEDIVWLMAGNQYMPSIGILRILSVLLIVIPLSNFIGFHVLYPVRKEKYGNYSTIAGALVNLSLNYFLVVHYSYVGIAISVLISESIVTFMHCYYGKKYFTMSFCSFFPGNIFRAIVPMIVVLLLLNYWGVNDNVIWFLLKIFIGMLAYAGTLVAMKDPFFMRIIKELKDERKYLFKKK